eukprot:7938287-Alexandrium_andersonii.AAC.1
MRKVGRVGGCPLLLRPPSLACVGYVLELTALRAPWRHQYYGRAVPAISKPYADQAQQQHGF